MRDRGSGTKARNHATLLFYLFAKRPNLLADADVDEMELVLHGPQGGIVSASQFHNFTLETFAYPRIGIITISFPTLQHGLAHAVEARTVAFEIVQKGEIQETL